MVRIIPVHNFLSQNVGQIEEPTASCTANLMDQDLLLLALSSHCVKVYGLASNQYKLLTIFPTVDLVQELVHSDKGNYVATLESKSSRDGAAVNNFVRVYINWEMTGNQNQAMRARIAGRVTPSLNRTLNSLEMIELPLNGQPTKIACCQTTGNLLVVMEDEAVIHELKVETQQTSKHKFLDFEVRPWSIRFTFSPTHVEFAEEFISVMNSWYFILIRLTNRFHDDNFISSDRVDKTNINNSKRRRSHPLKEVSIINNNNNCSEESKLKTRVDFNKSIINEREYIDWDQLVLNEPQETQRIKALGIVKEDNNLNVCFPSVKSDLSQSHYILDPPVIQATEISAVVTTRSYEDSWSENYIIEHLLRLKITEAPVQDGNEYFTCSILKPLYKRQKTSISNFKKSLLRSTKYNIFNGVTCLICTTQEGYLYNFLPNSSEEIFFDAVNCQIYPFTAPVIHVALENTALHALTEAGLESYTLRIQHLRSEEPPNDTPVSLIGLRPFLGVKKLLHASRCLVLLASDEDTWTFYSLNLPTAEDIYQDILTAANNHKTSPSTYKHLLAEANTVLKISKEMIYYTSDAAFFSSINDMSKSHLDNLYRQSCALLADFYMTSESPMDWGLSSWFYEVAGLKAHDVMARRDVKRAPGMVTFVSESLLNLQPGAEADTLFQEHNIVEILIKAEKSDLLKLILASPVLREYATDKLINVISNWEADDMTWLALVLLYTQAGRIHQAERALEPINDKFIAEKILSNWSWLFDVISAKKSNAMPIFSEFAGTLMRLKLRVFAQVLSKIVECKAVTLDEMIQIFLGYLPSRVGRDGRIAGNALQLCLETYLQSYHENFQCKKVDLAIVEAFKILVRSYLAELAQNGAKVCTNDTQVLFGSFRPRFLDNPLIYEKGKTNRKERTARVLREEFNESFKESIRLEVVKLQALLASGSLPEECYQEVQHFLETQKIEGSLSFKILCVRDTEKGIQLLADECPQALLDYAKDKYTEESDWKHFIQFLLKKMMDNQNNKNIYCIYDDLIRDTAIYIAQTMSMSGLKRILPNDSLNILQQYIDTSNQVVHADYIKTMIMGTGQHLLCNINF